MLDLAGAGIGGDHPAEAPGQLDGSLAVARAAVPGETTEYQPVPNGVYSYAAYELTVNGEKTDLPVIDWVGAEPMPREAFTYVLELNPGAGRWEMLRVVEVKTDR